MQVTETNNDGLKREYKIVLAAKDIDDKMEARLQEIGQSVRIPGFRPGKVPLAVLKQRFGSSVMGEVLEKAVQDSSSQAMMERGLRPAIQPKIEITAFDQGADLEYSMQVELLPEIEVMDFATVELERLKVSVPDDEVDTALERLAGSQKKTEPLSEPRKAEHGDVLVIDFRGSVDGEELPGMAAEGHHLELGSNQFVGTFEEQLIGSDKGDEKEITVTFPDEYVNEKLAGRDAVFKVTVNDILSAVPLPIDDDLAKRLGLESLDQLKDNVRQQIGGEYQQVSRSRMKRKLLDVLADGHGFEVPEGMVESEFEMIWHQIEHDRKEGNLDPEDEGKSDDELKSEYRTIAERRVRLGLLLSEVGRVNSIEVADEEVNQALLREVQQHPGREREVYEYFQNNPQALAQLRAPLYEDKVIDFIMELAKVEEREVTPDELREAMEADAKADEAAKPAASKPKAKAKSKAKAKKEEAGEDDKGADDKAEDNKAEDGETAEGGS